MSFQELFQSADWKKEKHSPVIEVIVAKKGQPVTIQVSIGKEIPHPNTTEHHINWIDLYFQPSGEKFAVQLGKFEFTAHGASITGANSSTIYSEPNVTLTFKTDKSGVLYASSYCNIHGLWASEQELKLD